MMTEAVKREILVLQIVFSILVFWSEWVSLPQKRDVTSPVMSSQAFTLLYPNHIQKLIIDFRGGFYLSHGFRLAWCNEII